MSTENISKSRKKIMKNLRNSKSTIEETSEKK